MLFFSVLSGVLSFLLGFSEEKFKISYSTSTSVTLSNFNLDLEQKFANLIL